MCGLRRFGATVVVMAILTGGTALGMASTNGTHQLFRAIADDRLPNRVIQTGTCAASFYWEPQGTASGETFDPEAFTAAHKSLPMQTRVRITNPANGKSVTVRINDRGPYIEGRCLDLSRAAFRAIANLETGVLKNISYEILAD